MKKIYIKNISNRKINLNLVNSLKNTYMFDTKTDYLILTNNTFYKYINNKLYKFELLLDIINENTDYCECNEKEIKKYISNQIPIEHKFIKRKTIKFKILENIYLAFDIIDNIINDYYVMNYTNLNIKDVIFKKDLSYIKNMLI